MTETLEEIVTHWLFHMLEMFDHRLHQVQEKYQQVEIQKKNNQSTIKLWLDRNNIHRVQHFITFTVSQFGTLPRVNSNELIDQLFVHIMSEKKHENGEDDIFTPKPGRKSSSAHHDPNKQRRMSFGMDNMVNRMKRLGSTSISSGSNPSKSIYYLREF